MITLLRREVRTENLPDMTRDELEIEWRKAKESLDQALIQKNDTARIYVAAANRLNALDRLVAKIEQREATARRAAAKALTQTS